MGKFDRLHIWYADEGMIGVLKAAWLTIVYLSPLYYLFDQVLGEELHEKLIRAPRIGYWPNIQNPESFNEKLLHRKIHTDDDRFARISDKYRVREYVTEQVGDQYLTELYCAVDDPAEIPFDQLPAEYVIKANNGCGSNIIVRGEADVDRNEIIKECEQWLLTPHGKRQREYWYQHIEPKIIVEDFINSDNQYVPRDYKFFVFSGKVRYIEVDTDRFSDHKRRFYDKNWEPCDFKLEYPLAPTIEKPSNLQEMISVAEKLGKNFDHIRIDLYNPGQDEVIFGEMTVTHGSGIEKFAPLEYDLEFGRHWEVEQVNSTITSE